MGRFVHPGNAGALGVLRIKQGGVGHPKGGAWVLGKGEALNAPAERPFY